jgi:hypothetical protein
MLFFEEKGAYIELLMMQFNRGHMGAHMIGQVLGQKVDELWKKLQHKFIQDENGLWYNSRLEIEQNKRKTYTESRKNNINGTNQYTKKDKNKSGHMTTHMGGQLTSHMENRNRNENSSFFEGVQGELLNSPNQKITKEDFEKFWEIYPKKDNKGPSRKTWDTLCSEKNRPTWREIKKAIIDQKKCERWQTKKYIPNPQRWLNGAYWLNDPAEMVSYEQNTKSAGGNTMGTETLKDKKITNK